MDEAGLDPLLTPAPPPPPLKLPEDNCLENADVADFLLPSPPSELTLVLPDLIEEAETAETIERVSAVNSLSAPFIVRFSEAASDWARSRSRLLEPEALTRISDISVFGGDAERRRRRLPTLIRPSSSLSSSSKKSAFKGVLLSKKEAGLDLERFDLIET